MAQVRISRVPVLPPNLPGIPQGGYGTPGINPAAPDPRGSGGAPSYWETLWSVFLGDLTGKSRTGEGAPTTAREERAQRQQIEQTAAAEAGPDPPSFCFGADRRICEGAGLFRSQCLALTNIACIALGVIVLLALLGIGLNALVR